MADQKKRGRRRLLIIVGIVAVLAVIVIMNLGANRERTVKVTVQPVKRQDITALISASGEVKPKKNIEISAQVPGRILKIGVVEGQVVKAGDFLMKLDSTQYEANADRDRAAIQGFNSNLIQAEASLARDRNTYDRQKKLFDDGLVSREQMEAAKAQFDVSEAQVEAYRAQIRQAEASLRSSVDSIAKTSFLAPIDGVITSLRVEEGEVAIIGTMNNPGTVLLTLADLSIMEVEIEVDETDVVNAALAQDADVRVDAFPGTTFKGKVTEIGSSAIQNANLASASSSVQESKDFKVVITLDDPEHRLRPGLSATADIISAKRPGVLAVPISALVIRDAPAAASAAGAATPAAKPAQEQEGVYVVESGRAKFQPVVKGIMGGMSLEVVSGLKEGQEIVSGPYSALRELKDGILLKPDKSAPAPAAKAS